MHTWSICSNCAAGACNAALAVLLLLAPSALAQTPRVLDSNYALQLVAEHPDIVTPIGMTFDARGRLLVIESHTHFRPSDYEGPTADRVRILEDTDGDGKADRLGVFWEGAEHAMSLATAADGSIYLATRSRIIKLCDEDNDGIGEREQPVVRLETPGNYPHNGLCGLCFDHDGSLIFGLGENLGADYRLVGSDGREFRGGGEGGGLWKCRTDGSHLEHIATGFWNPFGICVDPRGRLFTVENDPDSRPPCRLLHVVPGGDYGYQFRYGRSGRHPLQAWDGELPGTLGMVAGTGEAPSSVIPYEGHLWVTSWGDHQIERYRLVEHGASWRATSDVVVVGGESFRPVAFALAPDGALYFSDWVVRSYHLHRQGRIWKLAPKRNKATTEQPDFPPLSPGELRAADARRRVDWEAAASNDPFLWQAAVWGLVEHGRDELTIERLASLNDPRQRLAVVRAARWCAADAEPWVRAALGDADPDVRLAAVRWAADERLQVVRDEIVEELHRPGGTAALYRAAAATVAWLDRGTAEINAQLLVDIGTDTSRSAELRVWALRLLPPETKLSGKTWQALVSDGNMSVRREAVWALSQSHYDARDVLLEQVATDSSVPEDLRADAVVGLASTVEDPHTELAALVGPTVPDAVRREALRVGQSPVDEQSAKRPQRTDVDAWLSVSQGPGDAGAGRRVFFHAHGGRCFQCHRWNGQGHDVGPDLTDIGKRMTRRRLIESIVLPNGEVAPHYKAFLLETDQGEVLTGVTLGQTGSGDVERFVDSSGQVFQVHTRELVTRQMLSTSIMPEGLMDQLTVDDLRDLLEFLGATSTRE